MKVTREQVLKYAEKLPVRIDEGWNEISDGWRGYNNIEDYAVEIFQEESGNWYAMRFICGIEAGTWKLTEDGEWVEIDPDEIE